MKRKKMAPRRGKKKRNEKRKGGKKVWALQLEPGTLRQLKRFPPAGPMFGLCLEKEGPVYILTLKKKLKLRWGQGPPSPLAPPLVGNFLNEILTT